MKFIQMTLNRSRRLKFETSIEGKPIKRREIGFKEITPSTQFLHEYPACVCVFRASREFRKSFRETSTVNRANSYLPYGGVVTGAYITTEKGKRDAREGGRR